MEDLAPIRKDAPIEPDELNLSSMESSQKTYSSKSCDELDDVVLKDGQKERGKTMNNNADVVSRHSCDEVMMTRSFHEGEISDTSSQLSSDCQRCLLNSISNRTMSLDCEGFWTSSGQARLISQRQYKRKIKRDTPGYVTLERRRGDKKTNKIHVNKVEDEVDGFILDNGLDTIKVSKTTYKLETQNQEPDSIELMEIPTSPTNYEQPSTPECDPPSPARAEEEISKVIEILSKEHISSPLEKEINWNPKKVLQFASIGVGTDSGMNCINTTTMTNNQNTTSNNKIMELNILDDPGNKEVVNKEDSSSLNPNDSGAGSTEATRTSSILSPFDEKDEWLKISQIIDSFGTDIIGVDAKMNDEEETVKEESDSPQYSTWKRQEKVLNSVPEWLQYISCQQYADNFEVNGYDHLDFIGEGFISKEDLSDMGIKNENDCKHILESLISLKLSSVLMVETDPKTKISSIPEDVETWLESLHLSNYSEDFKKNNYDDMNRVKKIWDEELRTLLNIHKKGHRKRMLLSLMASSGDQTGSNAKSGFTAIDNRCKPPPLSQEQSSQASVPSKNDPSIGEHQHNTLQKQSSSTSSKKKKRGKEENSPSKTPPPVSKAHPLPPKLLKSKTTLMGRESLNLSGSNILSTTLGRRKKKTAPSTPAESNKKTSSKEEKIYLSYGVKYFGKKTVKDFKGNDSTKGAIEQIRRAKAGRLRYLLITDKTVTVIKRDTKEAVEMILESWDIFQNDKQKLTHVFSTDCKEKTSEILSVICEGFGEMRSKVKYQDPILPSSTGIIPGVLGNTPVASSGSDTKTSSPPSPVSKSKSDFLVSRMKLFFQGSSSSSSTNDSPSSIAPPIAVQSSISSSGAKSQEARRKRGGSVDDLIDRLDEPLTNESRLKSISTKNLNIIGSRTSSSSSSSSGAKSTVEEVKITTV
ncbi:ANKS1 [Lepeophtheirus salmonis]|uniref:ANKS1 n=1 Tax=Lepeophtheirus salmonis TaxID=72036 RepID=A0A7R8CY94_LEPSM|nr:ANKS1 [Lepeophtheirus salmonis]CAF2967649.1 ANKS1 [Lepeophtheirus salmonis]